LKKNQDDRHNNSSKRENSKTAELGRHSELESVASVKINFKAMKKNGLNWPYHPFQVCSWIFNIIGITSYFLVIAPCLISKSPIIMLLITTIYLITVILVCIYATKAVISNPTDRSVLMSRELMKKGITPEKGTLTLY
jgi:hypothetical protein